MEGRCWGKGKEVDGNLGECVTGIVARGAWGELRALGKVLYDKC